MERLGLPQVRAFDPPDHLDAFLDAVRWGAVSQADTRVLQAPFRSGIDIEDYQLVPLARAIQMPRVNLLIADDVGLGKTVEAGLVIQELIVRNRARKILIVCPAGLQIHWRDQMQEKFGLDFRIVDSDCIKRLRRDRGIRTNPWTYFPRLIISIDYIKGERSKRLLRDALPAEEESRYPRRFDVLIVDEAHNIAPAGGGRNATESQRAQVIRTLAPHFEHKFFLSATPHNGYSESLTALLALLDNQRFARGVQPDETQRRTVMVRRLKSNITRWDGQPHFPPREIHEIEVDYTDDKREVHRALKLYAHLRTKAAREVPNHVLPGNAPAAIAHARLVVIGGDYQRLHEEIIAAGGISHPRFSRLNVSQVERALTEQRETRVIEREQWRLTEFYNQHDIEGRLRLALEARADKEQRDIETILNELARTIKAELDEPDAQQLDLPGFNDEDRSIHKYALTVMMRLVFLMSAEDRDLMPMDNPLYAQHYAVSPLRSQLREAADQVSEAVVQRRHDAWSRLLATFRAVHGGVEHQDMKLPAYGGSLFDPDRFPFLEGRAPGSHWRDSDADPLQIDNRTVLHLLEALQLLQVRFGGQTETRRLSFRALDIE